MSVIYPRFLGIDGSGDFVWELADGRWTWGDDPHSAVTRKRTFEPERYVEKYGRPVPIGEQIDRQAEAEIEPAESLQLVVGRSPVEMAEAVNPATVDKPSASLALYAMLTELDSWIEGLHGNHQALDHRGENVGEECWTQFHPEDIRNMINDAARQLGLGEFPKPETAREDEVR